MEDLSCIHVRRASFDVNSRKSPTRGMLEFFNFYFWFLTVGGDVKASPFPIASSFRGPMVNVIRGKERKLHPSQ